MTEHNDSLDGFPIVEMFGQHAWHCEGALALNVEGTKLLAAALTRFATGGNPEVVQVFAGDGEGYHLHLLPEALVQHLPITHYLDAPGTEAGDASGLLYLLSKEKAGV